MIIYLLKVHALNSRKKKRSSRCSCRRLDQRRSRIIITQKEHILMSKSSPSKVYNLFRSSWIADLEYSWSQCNSISFWAIVFVALNKSSIRLLHFTTHPSISSWDIFFTMLSLNFFHFILTFDVFSKAIWWHENAREGVLFFTINQV